MSPESHDRSPPTEVTDDSVVPSETERPGGSGAVRLPQGSINGARTGAAPVDRDESRTARAHVSVLFTGRIPGRVDDRHRA